MRVSIAQPRGRNVLLRERQRFAVGNAQLPLHQIDAVDELGDRMLDLQPRVHFEEEEASVGIEHELAGAGVLVVDRLCGAHGGRAHRRAQFGRERDGGCFLDDFLMPALDRTFALAEMHGAAVRVGQHLKLDVARIAQIAFEQDGVVAERGQRFAFGRIERLVELRERFHHAHAAAAAAGAGFDQQRKTDALGFLAQRRKALIVAFVARHHRHVELAHAALRIDLAAHRLHRFR